MKSVTLDSELTPYQLLCRYCILHGMKLSEAAELWNTDFKHRNLSREDLLTRLNECLMTRKLAVNGTAEEDQALDRSLIEGNLIHEEKLRRSRERSLVHARLLLDDDTCRNCGYPTIVMKATIGVEILVDVHHVQPLDDGERITTVDDLVTLCPNCHRLIHVLGRISGERILDLNFLKRKIA